MKKLSYQILLLLFLCSCESISSKPNPSKSKRSFSNIDKTTYSYTKKKTSLTAANQPKSKSARLNRYNLNNLYDPAQDEYVAENSDKNIADDGDYEGIFKIGNPYEIQGVAYFPQNYEEFEEVGTASWYGADFHGKKTANGETYDSSTMTAAHRTLPLPSMVKVTNLRNNKSVIVRVNDRGPFAKNRVIDVSQKAAEELGFRSQGTTEVRVQLLRNDTDELLEKLKIKN